MREADNDSDAADFIKCELHLLLGNVIARAKQGDRKTIEALARLALRATAAVDEITRDACEKTSDLLVPLRAVARTQQTWPTLIAADESQVVATRKRSATLEKLQVGRDTLTALDFIRRANPTDTIGKVAIKLLEHIRDHGAMHQALHEGRGAIMQGKSALPPWAAKAAKLTTFTKDNAGDWWEVAQKIFENACPDPNAHRQLANLIAKSKRGTRGLRRNYIESRLAQRFHSLAPDSR